VKAGVPICYELLFPDLVRRFVKDGGQVLLGITNDAWYGKTGAPHQFLAITALRSAETGAWTVRAANTGVSAVIDGRGRVRERTAIFERGLIVADVPLLPGATGASGAGKAPIGATFYTRHGDVFAWTCWLVAALQLGRARVGRRPRGERDQDE
jgi:apolipoprotein N-acyltransferase